jgi:hypothetical protein
MTASGFHRPGGLKIGNFPDFFASASVPHYP